MWKLRGSYIAKLINELEAEGIIVDVDDEAMLRAYVRGDIGERDLLSHVCQFQDLTSYQQWLQQELMADAAVRRSTTSVEQLVHKVFTHFLRKYAAANFEGRRYLSGQISQAA